MNPLEFSFLPGWLKAMSAVAVAIVDRDGRIIEASQGFLECLPDAADSINDEVFAPKLAPLANKTGDGDILYSGAIKIGAAAGKRVFIGHVQRHVAGFIIMAELDAEEFRNREDEVRRLRNDLIALGKQLAQANRNIERLRHEAEAQKQLDAVTGLPGRQALDTRVEQEMKRWERYRRPLGLVLMEIYDFAAITEQIGRAAADEVLRNVATIVQDSIRSLDFAVRYGPQEFALLLPETNEMGALILAERLQHELERHIILPLVEPLDASFGAAMLLVDEKPQGYYARAERALRHSRQHGKNLITMAGVIPECDHVYTGQNPATPLAGIPNP